MLRQTLSQVQEPLRFASRYPLSDPSDAGEELMADIHYVVVEHDGGWAYKVGDVFSETFRTREDAHIAAEIAASEQRRAGDDEVIEYQDKDGRWKTETARGNDRPESDVED